MNQITNKILKNKAFVSATTALTSVYYSMMNVFCDDDIFSKAETGLGSLFTKLWGVASKLLPVAIAICVIAIFFTHDEKAIATEKRVLIGMIVAYALLWLIAKNSGIIDSTLTSLFS